MPSRVVGADSRERPITYAHRENPADAGEDCETAEPETRPTIPDTLFK